MILARFGTALTSAHAARSLLSCGGARNRHCGRRALCRVKVDKPKSRRARAAANTDMNALEDAGEICTVCGDATRGGFEVHTRTQEDGTPVIAVDATPDRDFN